MFQKYSLEQILGLDGRLLGCGNRLTARTARLIARFMAVHQVLTFQIDLGGVTGERVGLLSRRIVGLSVGTDVDVFGRHAVFVKIFLSQVLIVHDASHETSDDGKRRATSLSQCAGAEVNAALLSANPGTAHQRGGDTDEPGIGMVV